MHDEAAKISVIIPVYKVEKYLDRCIESVVNQTYTNLEIILVDDGSPDRSGEICDAWAHRDKRIRVIHQKNGGLSAARNAGLDIACGDYIGFVDSDDYIHQDMYLSMYQKAISCRSDIVVCGFERVDEKGNSISGAGFSPNSESQFSTISTRIMCVVWNKLYRGELFDCLRFPVGKVYEDVFVMPRLLQTSRNTNVIRESLYFYRQSADSITRSGNTVKKFDLCEAYYEAVVFYESIARDECLTDISNYAFYFFLELYDGLNTLTSGEKARICDVKRKVRYCYQKYGKDISKMDIFHFEMPAAFQFLRHIKHAITWGVKRGRING